MNYNNSYIGNLLNAISQLGHALMGGKSDISISAKIGYESTYNLNTFWRWCRWIVDTTFYPVDGLYHCYKAYESDPSENYEFKRGFYWGIILMVIFMLLICVPLSVIFWTYYVIKKIVSK